MCPPCCIVVTTTVITILNLGNIFRWHLLSKNVTQILFWYEEFSPLKFFYSLPQQTMHANTMLMVHHYSYQVDIARRSSWWDCCFNGQPHLVLVRPVMTKLLFEQQSNRGLWWQSQSELRRATSTLYNNVQLTVSMEQFHNTGSLR